MAPLQPQDVFRSDEFETADLAIVLGGPSPALTHRIKAAIPLVITNRVGKLLLTGYGPNSGRVKRRSEASQMREYALANGLSDDQILIEDKSENTVQNATKCLEMFASHPLLKDVRTIALVTSAWHMLRSLTIMTHHFPPTIRFFCHPATEGYTAANWQEDDEGIRLVQKELRLISKLQARHYKLPPSPSAD